MSDVSEPGGPDRDESIASDETTPAPEPRGPAPRQRSRLRRTLHLLLAPLLATAAVGVHWALNVPPGGVKISDKDQGAGKADPKKKKPAPKKKKGSFEPRPIGEVEASWARYQEVEFDAEPVKSAWARPHQSLVNKAVTLARKTAFEGAPEEPRVTVSDVECRTVRCRFTLRSPFAHEVDMLSETLSRLESESQSIWRGYTVTKIDPPTEDSPKSDTYVQVVVAFREDSMDSASFAVPEDAIVGGAGADTEEGSPRRPTEDDEDEDEKNGPRESGG
ncbi:MAG: hypothetical protein IAG13_29490 [Deltaproteobacteria bacterium]|nr:hypothetical protein [Nannocystaceae bacterium]